MSRADLQPGDLVFFYSPIHHVGIYIGDGKMIHAAGTGKDVRIDDVWTQQLHWRLPDHPLGDAAHGPPIAVYYHPLFLEHETGEHPENKERLVVAKQVLLDSGLDLEWITPEPAPVEAIARVHDPAYIDSVRRAGGGGRGLAGLGHRGLARVVRGRPAGGRRGADGGRRALAAGRRPSCWCVLPGTTPALAGHGFLPVQQHRGGGRSRSRAELDSSGC